MRDDTPASTGAEPKSRRSHSWLSRRAGGQPNGYENPRENLHDLADCSRQGRAEPAYPPNWFTPSKKQLTPQSGEVAYFFFDAQSAQNCGTHGSILFSARASAARLSRLQTSDLPSNWLRSVKKQLIPPGEVALFCRAQSAQIGKLVDRDSSRAGRAQLAYPRCKQATCPKLASFPQKTTYPARRGCSFFSVHKVHKLGNSWLETLLGPGGRSSPIPVANKRLAPNWLRSVKNKLIPPRRGCSFSHVHKVHKLGKFWRSHALPGIRRPGLDTSKTAPGTRSVKASKYPRSSVFISGTRPKAGPDRPMLQIGFAPHYSYCAAARTIKYSLKIGFVPFENPHPGTQYFLPSTAGPVANATPSTSLQFLCRYSGTCRMFGSVSRARLHKTFKINTSQLASNMPSQTAKRESMNA